MTINWRAARTSLILSVLFLVVYGATNRLAATREGVPSIFMPWERQIPFVPLTFIPYVSIDLLFAIAPFLCRTDEQRRALAWRLAAATLLGGMCFLLFPLKFAFERPPVEGWLGRAFDVFRQMDQPFNQCPSLHIAMGLILLPVYLRRFQGVAGLALFLWFMLILASPVLTWQHHLIDIVGGVLLAAVCCYLFREQPLRTPVTVSSRIASYYGTGTLVVAALSFVYPPWTLVLLWPALTLAITTAAYLGVGAGIYRKADGRIPLAARLFLWPVLLGQRASLARYSRRGRPWNELCRNVIIGRRLNDDEAKQLRNAGVTATLDLTGEFDEAAPLLLGSYLNLPILDLSRPTGTQIEQGVAFVRDHAERGTVYIHCKLGYSRTAAIAGVYLLRSGVAHDADGAIARLRAARPDIIIRPEAEAAIRAAVR